MIRAEGQQRVLHVVQSFVTTNTYETAQYLQRNYGNQIIRNSWFAIQTLQVQRRARHQPRLTIKS